MIRLVLAIALLAGQAAVADLHYDADPDVLRLPADVYLGEIGGVGTNSKGQIFVYTRTGHPYATLGDNRTFAHGGSRLFEFDRNREVRARARTGRLRLQRRHRPPR